MNSSVLPHLPPGGLDLIDRARDSLVCALAAPTPGERYVAAHLAALRAAAAVLAVRGRPSRAGRTGGPCSIWQVLPVVAPELQEWAAFFAAGAPRRAAVEAGRADVVSSREADDLVRDGESFLLLVEVALGLPRPDVSPTGAGWLRPPVLALAPTVP